MRARLFLVALLFASDASAGDRIEGILRILARLRSASGEFPPTVPRFFGYAVSNETVGVTIRFVSPPTVFELQEVEEVIGGRIPRLSARRIRFHRTTVAEVPWNALADLAALPRVERIDIGRRPGTRHPMDVSVPEIEATEVWKLQDAFGSYVTGAIDEDDDGIPERRMIIADIDSGIDIFHPMFFHANGPTIDYWQDVDGNGEFDPGVDTIEFGEGEETTEVTLSLQEGVRVRGGGNEGVDGRYNPSTDWLYIDGWSWHLEEGGAGIDTDRMNGRRDFGRRDGFEEDDPSYGEPILILEEDPDAPNDRADVNEPFVVLGTSRIRAVMEPVVHVRERGGPPGDDLIGSAMNEPRHGTGVASILLGGWPGIGRRFTGVAPGAELVLATLDSSSFPVGAGLPFAMDQDADVVLYEFGYLVTSFLDGSTNDEQMIAEAAAAGIPQVTPTGNWGDTGKTIRVSIQAAEAVDIGATIPEDRRDSGVSGISIVQVTFRWREPDVRVHGELEVPGLGIYRIDPGEEDSHDDIRVLSELEVSDRGTAKLDVMVIGTGATLPVGEYTWQLVNEHPETPIEVWGGGVDDRTGFFGGFVFTDHTDSSTSVAGPATADGAIAVGSYSTRDSGGRLDRGALSGFSGRGRRIDGEPIVDVTAPGDNDVYWARAVGANRRAWGYYAFGGGTSAAGPHVAGGAALLLQLAPWSRSADIERAIQEGALADEFTGATPNDDWGWGKLRLLSATDFLPDPPAVDPGESTFWGLNRPVSNPDSQDAAPQDAGPGSRSFSVRGGWQCAAGTPAGAAPGPWLLVLAALALCGRGRLRLRRLRRDPEASSDARHESTSVERREDRPERESCRYERVAPR